MQKDPHHTNTFSAADIERYHNGQMSAQEMHQLEKAALDDPFLTDALEGYALTPTPKEDATNLHQKLQQRLQGKVMILPKKKKYFTLFAIAATVLLVTAATWFMYQLAGMGNNNIALEQPTQKTQETAVADTVTTSASQLSTETHTKKEPTTVQSNKKPVTNNKQSKSAVAEDVQLQRVQTLSQEEAAGSGRFSDSITLSQEPFTAGNSRQQVMRKNSNNPVSTFKGQVKDAGNNPVPNATITNEKKEVVTTTDSNGNFSLTTPDSTLEVTVSAAGYKAENKILEISSENKILLQPSGDTLNKAAIASRTMQPGATIKPSRIKVENAEPVNGWMQWEQYVAANLKTNETLKIPSQQGAIILSFDIDENGKAVNIKVDQSLCAPCDAEAIRILQKGPMWRQKNKTRATARVQF